MVIIGAVLLALTVGALLWLPVSLLAGALLMWLENLCHFWTDFGYWHNVWITFAGGLLLTLMGITSRVKNDD